MPIKKTNMRLFNGHHKLEEASLRKVFLMQLGNIFSVKTYLIDNLPLMAESASFQDLKFAILETIDDIRVQLLRMDVIYKMIGEHYQPQQCMGVRALTIEIFVTGKTPGLSHLERDLLLLYHLNNLESIEISSFTFLRDMALSMPVKDMTILLHQNLDMAKDNKELFEMITREYIN
jgi:ferritin-like metal-binding protein YciE